MKNTLGLDCPLEANVIAAMKREVISEKRKQTSLRHPAVQTKATTILYPVNLTIMWEQFSVCGSQMSAFSQPALMVYNIHHSNRPMSPNPRQTSLLCLALIYDTILVRFLSGTWQVIIKLQTFR